MSDYTSELIRAGTGEDDLWAMECAFALCKGDFTACLTAARDVLYARLEYRCPQEITLDDVPYHYQGGDTGEAYVDGFNDCLSLIFEPKG